MHGVGDGKSVDALFAAGNKGLAAENVCGKGVQNANVLGKRAAMGELKTECDWAIRSARL